MEWDLIGHDWAVDLLREHIIQGCFRHAYLFTGPPGVGRRTLALRFAQVINCQNPPLSGERCGACRACRLIETMQHPDLVVLQAETLRGTLKVDAIRELQHILSLTPFEAQYRLALLLRFEEANLSAANALLKTLEEPSPSVILLLTAEDQENLPETIVSRCEVIRLRPVSLELIERGLVEYWNVPEENARFLASISGGRPGYAYMLAKEPALLVERSEWLQDIQELLIADRVKRFMYAEKIVKEKIQLHTGLQIWISFWRDILLKVVGCSPKYKDPDYLELVNSIASKVNLDEARNFIASLLRTQELLARNINRQLALEVLLLALPRINE